MPCLFPFVVIVLWLTVSLAYPVESCSCSMSWTAATAKLHGASPECIWQPLQQLCPCARVHASNADNHARKTQKVCVPIEPVPPEEAYTSRRGHNEPMSASITYKGGLLDIKGSGFKRLVYIDLGANAYPTSIGRFLRAKYPHGSEFFVEAFEPSVKHRPTYESAGDNKLRLHQFAAWTKNTTLQFSSYGPTGAYHVGKPVLDPTSNAKRPPPTIVNIPALDIAEFIRTHVAADDFVIVKCDIEGAEYEVLPYLSSVSHLIDEVFAEVHYYPANPLELVREKTVKDARALVATLREKGMYAHAWN